MIRVDASPDVKNLETEPHSIYSRSPMISYPLRDGWMSPPHTDAVGTEGCDKVRECNNEFLDTLRGHSLIQFV